MATSATQPFSSCPGRLFCSTCQSLAAKIFLFTEIRFRRMCRPSRLTRRGDLTVVTDREPGMRWTRQRRACDGAGWAGSPCEPEAVCRRTALRLVSPTFFRPRARAGKPCGEHASRRVRQNRVVLAVVATVKPSGGGRESNRADDHRQFARRGRPEGIRLPGERGISRQPIAQGRPCVRPTCMLLCGLLLYHSRSRPRVPAGARPSLRLLGSRGRKDSKARAKSAARSRSHVCV